MPGLTPVARTWLLRTLPSKAVASEVADSTGPAEEKRQLWNKERRHMASGGIGGMRQFYTEDSSGLKVCPVPVLVMSLLFITSVFMLHIWGKYTPL